MLDRLKTCAKRLDRNDLKERYPYLTHRLKRSVISMIREIDLVIQTDDHKKYLDYVETWLDNREIYRTIAINNDNGHNAYAYIADDKIYVDTCLDHDENPVLGKLASGYQLDKTNIDLICFIHNLQYKYYFICYVYNQIVSYMFYEDESVVTCKKEVIVDFLHDYTTISLGPHKRLIVYKNKNLQFAARSITINPTLEVSDELILSNIINPGKNQGISINLWHTDADNVVTCTVCSKEDEKNICIDELIVSYKNRLGIIK